MILLIGGCGFIGSHVADSLLARGLKVRVFDRRPEALRPPLAGVDYVIGDFSDSSLIYEAMSGVDAVIHLASTTVPATSNLDPVADIKGNLVATVQLLEVMRTTEVRKLVYLSSGGTVYGIPETEVVPETHPLRPISSYGIVKVAIENYLFMQHKLHGLQHVVLRASNPYGPRQGHTGVQGIIGTHLWRTARGEPVEIWGDGSVVRDFIHVRDLAELCAAAVQSDVAGCYNAGSGTGASVAQIVDSISRTVEQTGCTPMAPVYKPGRSLDVPRVVLDITRACRDFDWTPRIGLDEGIAESWQWVRGQVQGA
ncbi:dTDP-4-dehydro-6-deoxyglucose reductase [Roseovarius sp. A-2]|uniref:NAD-dependent epimerase/dehydratase family protein n=1 Tax=Roseovarius sp. A-2 TaxID=1570360 RepID=UPI0009B548C9|nr:NAD-dependent epimerase/dehydratase family protein [Roseovarius sp. A-2]GAW37229.1 dTDP-4-dehydro-6-deoxyglucose reductase [Roseovarius sp. A-2]